MGRGGIVLRWLLGWLMNCYRKDTIGRSYFIRSSVDGRMLQKIYTSPIQHPAHSANAVIMEGISSDGQTFPCPTLFEIK